MNYSSTKLRIATLKAVLDAVNKPDVPNGTTVKINRIVGEGVGALLELIEGAARSVNVPNGTTKKVLRVMEVMRG